MSGAKEPAGLAIRIAAAARLAAVLRGEQFRPLGATELPDGRNRAVANRLVTTALRRHRHLDGIIADLLDRGLPPRSGSFEAVLRIALAQLLFLPELGAHSAIFLAVEALKRDKKTLHLKGLMNAVLRRAQARAGQYWDLPPASLFADWLQQDWTSAYGEAAVSAMGEALLAPPPLDLTIPGHDPDLIESLGGWPLMGDTVRIPVRDAPVEALPGYAEGRWWVQDAASAIPARLLDLAPGARVLDLCAAPGGKTAQLATAGYAVTALDADGTRLDRLRANLDRLGLSAIILQADATTFAPEERFDAVLVDAPCSGTGIFRRHPDVLLHRTKKDITQRLPLQRRLLRNGLRCLAPGGTLIYSVCSLQVEEGEEQARWAAESLGELVVDPVREEELNGLEPALTPEGVVRAHPGLLPEQGGIDGFFVARFRKISEEREAFVSGP